MAAEFTVEVETHVVTRLVVEADNADDAERKVGDVEDIDIERLIAGQTTHHDHFVCRASTEQYERQVTVVEPDPEEDDG